ncbi:TPA: Ig domain-containing protein [Escherichia coli]
MPSTAIAVTPATSSGVEGSTVTLTANLTPAGATDTVQWSSSDPAVATVASTGQKTAQVTRVAEGSAIITAKARTYTATIAITVTAP